MVRPPSATDKALLAKDLDSFPDPLYTDPATAALRDTVSTRPVCCSERGPLLPRRISIHYKGESSVEGLLALLWFFARFILWIALVGVAAWLAGLLVRWIQNR